MFKRRKRILFAGALLALGLCVVWFSRGEPKYQGRTLSAWLDIYRNQKGDAMARFKAVTREQLGEQSTKEQSEAADAVRQIGHKAIPTLLRWVKYHPPAWKRKLAGALRKIEQTSFGQWRVVEKALRSLESPDEIQIRTVGVLGLAILGEQAAPAIPELVQMTNDPDESNRSRALGALTRLGRVGLVALQKIAANSDSPNSLLAVRYMASMKYLGTNARPVIPLLVQVASDPDPDIAREGIYTLCVLGLEPGLCFPVFTNAIGSTNTSLQIHTIHHIGYFARAVDLRPLVPSLTNCLNSPDLGVRSKAVQMLTHVARRSRFARHLWQFASPQIANSHWWGRARHQRLSRLCEPAFWTPTLR